MMDANTRYPALMAYITERNRLGEREWCNVMWKDEASARDGNFSDVASEMDKAQADYAEHAKSIGHSPYPYNRSMGEFLGLAINPGNGEPGHGYYMASGVRNHYALGQARREVERLISAGKTLKIVLARDKLTRKPVRCAKFVGDQIKIDGNGASASNGRRKVTLSSNWSVETCMERLAYALRTGLPYGETE